MAKHASLRQQYKQAEEELKEVKQLHTDEILKRETAEQQLVGAKMKLAELKQKIDEYVLVVRMCKYNYYKYNSILKIMCISIQRHIIIRTDA